MRSNRITIPIKTAVSTIIVLVGGKNVPGTMRMASVVVDEIRRDANVFKEPDAIDLENLWRRKTLKRENDYNLQNWV